jgi:hypothetical protein
MTQLSKGLHFCEYCMEEPVADPRFDITSSGDVTMEFSSGRIWVMPDMILHYVEDHKFLPEQEFVDDVMNGQLTGGERLQTKAAPRPIGYLEGPFPTGNVPEGFIERLEELMQLAEKLG